MKKLLFAAAAAVVAGGLLVPMVQAQRESQVKTFMRAKLDHAQELLEALALEDYRTMAQHAHTMKILSLDTSWQILQTSEYGRFSEDFRRACDSLTKAADKKNLDGAALAYFQLTISCIDCHKYVRGARQK